MIKSLTCAFALVSTLAAALPATAATEYTITSLTSPTAGVSVQAFGINSLGQVSGSFASSAGQQAFVYSGGSYTLLSGPTGALGAGALGISDTGVVVGSWYDTTTIDPGTGAVVPTNVRGYVLDGGVYTSVAIPDATFVQMRGISPDGRWASGYFTAADGTNRGFVLDRSSGTITDITTPGSFFTLPQGINSAGIVAGSDVFTTPPASRPAFLYDITAGTRMSYSFAGYTRTAFRDITDGGVIAGWLQTGALTIGFVGTPDSFETLAVNGSTNTTIQGINELGWLAGNYALADGTSVGFVAVPVPEPATALMLVLGAAAVGWRLRQQRSAV